MSRWLGRPMVASCSLLCVISVSGCGDASRDAGASGGPEEGIGSNGETLGGESSDSNSTEPTTGEPSTDTHDPTTTTNPTTGTDDETETTADDSGVKFDLTGIPDAGLGECGVGGMGEGVLSYIWVANSSEGTISKIDTKTMVEEGRYITRPDGVGSPSRTSVNLAGDVAVANRVGGITKVYANHENCDEMQNGVPGLQTSTGKFDVLAWGQDDCVAWHTPINYTANRPAAWTFGTINEATCEVYDTKFWTGASTGAGANAHAMRLNGDTGEIEADILLPGFVVNGFGPYGGAVDPDENFWMISHSTGADLVRIDQGDLSVTVWDIPAQMFAYGFTIDEFGRPWIGGAGGSGITLVFDPETEQFTTLPKAGLGMGQDTNGIMWQAMFSSQNGVRGWDIETLQIVTEIDIPVSSSRGVSVDIDGFVWFIEVGSRAFKIDPELETYEVYDGLNGAYTYSDMTGNALSIVAGGIAG
ncbi:Methionine ABC transporter ATP-binding protein [Enhygromyxa salina]|uniref:Methionine ABC transporter ATP-binding protein n=1 Tax=Enhygromyxa salina TaxID=215803 RepID=A0A0C2D346_9BACT|nr:hypothetical protein [Enhygromyxa salina]KIG17661.1 Methionine ABC transporter ATP-binding protein [Enhygromyxa salina]